MSKEIIDFYERKQEIYYRNASKPALDFHETIEKLNRGDVAGAVDECQKLSEIHTQDASVWYNLGFALGERGLAREAVQAYRSALKIDAYFQNARYNLALELISLNELVEAEKELKTLVSYVPNDTEAHFELARLYEEGGLFDFALFHYNRILKINAQFRLINFCRANVHFRMKNYEEAVTAYREELAINPGFSEAHEMIKMVEEALLKKKSQNKV